MVQAYGRRGAASHDHSSSGEGGDVLAPTLLDTDTATITTTLDYPVQPAQNVTGSRALGTWYQNTTGVPLLVTVVTVESGSGNLTRPQFQLNDTQNDNTVDQASNVAHDANNVFCRLQQTVPDTYYYKVNELKTGSLSLWSEAKIGES